MSARQTCPDRPKIRVSPKVYIAIAKMAKRDETSMGRVVKALLDLHQSTTESVRRGKRVG